MANYDVNKIEVLFSLCLAKAKAERNRAGFDKLSQSINQDRPPTSIQPSQKYLDENIHKQLLKSVESNKEVVGLNHKYIEVLAEFLDFGEYTKFSDSYDRILKITGWDELTSIHFFYEEAKEDEIKLIVSELSYPNQEYIIDVSLAALPEKANFKNQKEIQLLQVLFVSSVWIEQRQLKLHTTTEDSQILYIHYDENEQVEFEGLSKMELSLIYQMLSHNVNPEAPFNKQQDKLRKGLAQTTNIHDSGAINLGTIGSIKAKYISSRDMHINIKKKK